MDKKFPGTQGATNLLPPQGFRPEGEIPRRHSSNSRVFLLWKVPTVEIYMAIHGYTWHYMALHGYTWPFLYIS